MFFAMHFGFLKKRSTIDDVAGITEQIRQGSIDTLNVFCLSCIKQLIASIMKFCYLNGRTIVSQENL